MQQRHDMVLPAGPEGSPRCSLKFRTAQQRFQVLSNIFSFLPTPRDHAACARTCTLWRPIADDSRSWQALAIRFGADPNDMGHAKLEVRMRVLRAKANQRGAPVQHHSAVAVSPQSTSASAARVTMAGAVMQAATAPAQPPRTVRRDDGESGRDRFSDGIASRPKVPARPGTQRSESGLATVPIHLPRRTPGEEMALVTSAAYRRAGSRPLTADDQTVILEEHARALTRRLQFALPQCKSLEHNYRQLASNADRLKKNIDGVDEERRRLQRDVPATVWATVALDVRAKRFDLFATFESRCVQAILHNHGSQDRDHLALPAVALTSFAQLEMLCANPRYIGTPVYLRYTQFKRALPLTDTYYDARDVVLDPATFDVDEYVVGRELAGIESVSRTVGADVRQRLLRAVLDEVCTRKWGERTPPLVAAILEKVVRLGTPLSSTAPPDSDDTPHHDDIDHAAAARPTFMDVLGGAPAEPASLYDAVFQGAI